MQQMPSRSESELVAQVNAWLGLRVYTSLSENLHELFSSGAEALRQKVGDDLKALQREFQSELSSFNGFTDFFNTYLADSQVAQSQAPTFFRDFEELLDAKEPALLEAMEQVQDVLARQRVQPSASTRRVQTWTGVILDEISTRIGRRKRIGVTAGALGFGLMLILLWYMARPHERDRWIRLDGTLACPSESDIEQYQRFESQRVRQWKAADLVRSSDCMILLAKERVRIESLSQDGARAHVIRSQDQKGFWISTSALRTTPP